MADIEAESPLTSEELGRSYAALVGEPEVPGEPPSVVETETSDPPPPPARILEALLFVGGEPLTVKRARGIVRGLTDDQFDEAIAQLNADYRRQNRPYAIQTHEHGWVLTLRPRYRHVIEKLYGGVREARLSTAAIDVLALVAYRQPLSKGDVDSLRGSDSGALLRQLVRRGLIQIVPGSDKKEKLPEGEPSRAARGAIYETTPRFLLMFGLQSLDDLPKTHDLQQL